MNLTKADIQKIASNFDIGDILNFKKADKGVVNHNWIVSTDKGKFVLRGTHKERTVGEVLFEHKFLKYLENYGFSYRIPLPLITKDGKSIVKFRNRRFWLYKFIEGSVSIMDRNKVRQVAKMMAEMHEVGQKIKIKPKGFRPIPFQTGWLIKSIEKSRKHAIAKKRKDTKDLFFIKNSVQVIKMIKSIRAPGYSRLPRTPIHSDINYENIIFKKGRLVGVIDFDNWRVDTKISDITAFIIYECRDLTKKNGFDEGLLKAFLDEYKKHGKLSRKEIRFVPLIATNLYSDAFWWCYHILENEPYRKYNIKNLRRSFKAANIFYNNRKEVEKLLQYLF